MDICDIPDNPCVHVPVMLRSGVRGKLPSEGIVMTKEVMYQDGSTSTFREGGGSFHDGDLAIHRLRLITARSALRLNLDNGMQLTRNGWQAAMRNVIEPLTGKTYKASRKGKTEALADCEYILEIIEAQAVIYEDESC